MSVSAILSAQQGPYAWRERDCLTTAAALIEGLAGWRYGNRYRHEIRRWHGMAEPRAIALIRARFGGVGSAHAEGFGARPERYGIAMLPGAVAHRPGDIVQLAGRVEVMGGWWDTAVKGDLLGFVADGCEILHWCPSGLAAAVGECRVERVFRCRQS